MSREKHGHIEAICQSAGAALVFGFSAMAFAAEQPWQSQAALHTVPTNLPGVYAFTQPPASFDPHRAADLELVAWGYPARPAATDSPTKWARWEQEVNLAEPRVVPELRRRSGSYHRPIESLSLDTIQAAAKATAVTASNWSGFALVPNSGAQPYALVEAAWTVPTVKQAPGTCSGGWDYSSQWVGLGGFSDSNLLQAGSAANVFCDIGANLTEYFPWIEWLPEAELIIYADASTGQLLPFAPGDYLIVAVTATNWSGGVSTSGTLSFRDVTQAWSVSLTFTASALGGSKVTGKSAEWIVERTEVNGAFATLPDYVTDPWWSTNTRDLGSVFHYPGEPGNATAYQITMLGDNGANESFVNLVGPNAMWFFPEGSATK
jgi:hypothetical protein